LTISYRVFLPVLPAPVSHRYFENRPFVVSRLTNSENGPEAGAPVITLGDTLGLDHRRRSIELEPQVAALLELGLCRGQGFLFAKQARWMPSQTAPSSNVVPSTDGTIR